MNVRVQFYEDGVVLSEADFPDEDTAHGEAWSWVEGVEDREAIVIDRHGHDTLISWVESHPHPFES